MFISNEVYYICTLSYRLYTEVQTAKQIQRYNNMDDGEHNALNTDGYTSNTGTIPRN